MAKRTLMRAISVAEFGGPKVLKLSSEVPRPSPSEKELLIKVSAVGVNPVDTYIRSGQYSRVPSLPYTPGSDLAGVVQAVGTGITKFKEGDRVFTVRTETGAYAEYAISNEVFTYKLHDSVTFAQGAALGVPYFTAYKALIRRGQAQAGDTVLVHGASGAVGLAACQIGKAHQMKVLGTAGTDDGLELVRNIGADDVFNHRSKGYMQKIMDWTGGKGVDVILEMVANVNLANDLDILASKGRVIVIGSRGPIQIDPRATMGKETEIRGMALFSSSEAELNEYGEAIVKGAEDGWVKPVIGIEYDLTDADKAHEEVMAHKQGTKGKIILKV